MFVFVSGSTTVRRTVQQVVDYCPLHRGLHPFDLIDVRSTGHLYGIRLGSGRHLGHELRSATCPHVRVVDPTHMLDPPQLRHRDRLQLEQRLRASPESVPIDVRRRLLHEAVVEIARVQANHGGSDVDVSLVRREMFATVMTATVGFVIGVIFQVGTLMAFGILGGVLGVLACLVLADVRSRLRVRRGIAETAITAIRPLAVGEEDVTSAVAWARSQGFDGAKRIDVGAVAARTDPGLAVPFPHVVPVGGEVPVVSAVRSRTP